MNIVIFFSVLSTNLRKNHYDLFSTASYATLDTYLKNDPIVKFKTVLDAVSQMFSSEIQECFEKK
ncbi:MAG: hypothetical protein MR556_06960, partial [Succinatimonas sp.]|nr:hypothetical protein [Succinatimonas sp.]